MKKLQQLRSAFQFKEVQSNPIFSFLSIATFATKMRGTVTKNKKDSQGRRLGLKKVSGEGVFKNDIILRQRGFKYKPGENVHYGKDQTLHASKEGVVTFTTDPYFNYKRTRVHVIEQEIRNKEVRPPKPFMYHPELYPELAKSNLTMEPYLIRGKVEKEEKKEIKTKNPLYSIPYDENLLNKRLIYSLLNGARSTNNFEKTVFNIDSVQKKLIPNILLEAISKSKEIDEITRDREVEIDEILKDHLINFELNKKKYILSKIIPTVNMKVVPIKKLEIKEKENTETAPTEVTPLHISIRNQLKRRPKAPFDPKAFFQQSEEDLGEVINYLSLDNLNSKIKSCETIEELKEFKTKTQEILDQFNKLLQSRDALMTFSKNLLKYTSVDKENLASKYIALKYYNVFKSFKSVIQKESKIFEVIIEKIGYSEKAKLTQNSYLLKKVSNPETEDVKALAFKRREVKVNKKLHI